MGKERNESGQYVNTIDRSSILEAVQEGGHVITTRDVADSVGISREAARQKLVTLEEQGRIEKEGNGSVWWMESPWPDSPEANHETPHQRRRRRKQAGKEVVSALVEHLRENGQIRESDLKDVAWEVGGDTYIEDKDMLWDAAKSSLANHNDIKPGSMGPWRFTGEP